MSKVLKLVSSDTESDKNRNRKKQLLASYTRGIKEGKTDGERSCASIYRRKKVPDLCQPGVIFREERVTVLFEL